jgi:hypothetical protein
MKRRTRAIIVLTAALLLTTVVLLPRVTEAKRLKVSSAVKNLSLTSALTNNLGPNGQDQKGDITVVESYHNDTSIPLRKMKPQPVFSKGEHEANENPKIPHKHIDSPDPVVQGQFSTLKALIAPNMPAPILNFDGIPFPGVACNCAPPDTNGEVGATQYVQIVNEGFQVFNKTTGASMLGPVGIATVWSGFTGPCETAGHGDPVALYDQLANRWLISQFAGAGVPTDECIAVSTTSDATGSWNRYAFHLGSNFFDYPHLGVWPDGYYMAMNVFNSAGTAFLGPQPFAFDRTKMLAGQPATFITTGITGGPTEETYLPTDLDGSLLPPVGAPASFVEFPGANTFRVFHFHVDFVTPLNSTFTLFASPASAVFTARTAGVPQVGAGASALDPIGDRLMFRAATRFFADGHESVVGNFTVQSGGVAAVRWFELRNTTVGPVTVFQQGTYQPDTTHRWMGSAAMDQQGNVAVGYSASSSSINPQIRYAGRLVTDAVNTLPQAEVTLFAGTGSQTGGLNRWGDYSDMTVDPVDDCTFWYTTEYIPANGSFNWRTRIGSFKYPGCGVAPTPDFSLSTTPSSVTVTAGSTANYTENVTRTGGFTGSVSLSISGLPAGAAGTFTPNPNTGATSALAITTSSTTPAGSYVFTVTGTSTVPPLTRNSTATLVVQTPDFSLSTTPSSVTVTAGSTASYTENVTRTGGFTGPVTLSISGLPAGAAGTFTPNPNTGATSALAVTTSASTPAGSYVFTVTGTSTSPALTRTSTATLVVQPPATGNFTLTITPTSRSINPGQSTTYTVNITRSGGFTGAVTFSVSGLGTGATGTFSPNPATGASSTLTVITTTSATPGTRTFTVTGTSGGLTRTVTGTLVIKNCVNGQGDC